MLFSCRQIVSLILVLSTKSLMVIDQRTLVIKYRIPVAEIEALSLSPYNDRLIVFHLRKVGGGNKHGFPRVSLRKVGVVASVH